MSFDVARRSHGVGGVLLLALALASVGCGDAPTTRPGASAAEADATVADPALLAGTRSRGLAEGLALPEVATIGDLPPPSTRVVLRIDADGALSLDGRPVAEDALGTRVRAAARGSDVLLAVDRSVPWAATSAVLRGATSALRTDRVHFLVAPEGGGEPGSMATFLPGSHEHCCAPEADTGPVLVEATLAQDGATDLAALHAALRALPPASRQVRVGLAVPPLAATGDALRAADVVFRSGFRFVGFQTDPSDPAAQGPLRELAARARHAPRAVRWTLGGAPLEVPPAGLPALPSVARVVGKPAGDWRPPAPVALAAPSPTGPGVLLEDTDEVRRPDEVARASDAGPAPVVPTAPASTLADRPRRPRTTPVDPVERSLEWLALHQAPDGRFGAQDFGRWCRGVAWEGPAVPGAGLASRDRESTALALLAFFGAGWTPRSDHPNGRAAHRALVWLIAQLDADGGLGGGTGPEALRDHALGTLALAAADRALGGARGTRAALVRAVAFAAAARNPGGGWGRGVRSGDLDVVTTAWMALAWTEARLAAAATAELPREPVPLDDRALTEARDAVVAATDAGTGVLVGAPTDPLDDATAAAALVVRRLAGEDLRGAALAPTVRALLAARAERGPGRAPDPSTTWFTTIVAFEHSREPWRAWEASLKSDVLEAQRADGEPCEAAGSWDPPPSDAGGRVVATALRALVAEVYYRYDRVPTLDRR